MYTISKGKSRMSTITLRNEDIDTEINLGQITTEIISILAKDGYTIVYSDSRAYTELSVIEEWEHREISHDVAKELSKTILHMKKPVKKVKVEQQPEPVTHQTANTTPVNALDIILGLDEESEEY